MEECNLLMFFYVLDDFCYNYYPSEGITHSTTNFTAVFIK